ncbi:MAG: hypothetical protein K2N28_06520 [Muribaculaceae bacterium]|nr:hypothetical protein [Muribaculaceae bacterium]
MSKKFIHVFAVGLFMLAFMSSFSASSREGTAIRCIPIYNEDNHIVDFDTVRLKNIIGKNFYDVFDTDKLLKETIPNRKDLMKLLPACTSTDTIVVISSEYWGKKYYSNVKFNNILFGIKYGTEGQYKLVPVDEYYKPTACAQINTDMIMLNVFFEWNTDMIKCMMSSTPFITHDHAGGSNLAQRFILQDGLITDYQEIKFDEASWWFLSDCYSRDSIPTKYLRDLRYDSPDSLITRYLQGVCYDYYYWKRYRP